MQFILIYLGSPTVVDEFLIRKSISFLQDINSCEIYKSFSSIGFASDAYIKLQSIVDSISQRFDSVLRKIKSIDGFIRLQLWMETVLLIH